MVRGKCHHLLPRPHSGEFVWAVSFFAGLNRHKDTWLDSPNFNNGVDMFARSPALRLPICVGQSPGLFLKNEGPRQSM